jgi:hypothetical protein
MAVKRPLGDVASAQQQPSQQGNANAITGQVDQKPSTVPAPAADAYRMVDFVRAVAMHDDRGQEVRVNRVRLGGSVDRESPEKVVSIVLNGAWFDIATNGSGEKTRDNRCYRVHVTNTVSAER